MSNRIVQQVSGNEMPQENNTFIYVWVYRNRKLYGKTYGRFKLHATSFYNEFLDKNV